MRSEICVLACEKWFRIYLIVVDLLFRHDVVGFFSPSDLPWLLLFFFLLYARLLVLVLIA
jgi:hypothetical protein